MSASAPDDNPGPASQERKVEVGDGGRVTRMTLEPVMPDVIIPDEKPEATPVTTSADTPKDESDPTLDAAKADEDGNLPVDEPVTPADDVTPDTPAEPNITLEQVFDAANSADGLTDEQGLHTIAQIAGAFGGDTERAAEMAQQYMAGRQAQTQLAHLQIISEALPSYDRYAEVMEFARQNKDIAKEYNEGVAASKNAEDSVNVLRTLNNRYDAHYGSSGKPVIGETVTPASVEYITSRAQYQELMQDERYKTSAEYRQGLMNRLRASKRAGVYVG